MAPPEQEFLTQARRRRPNGSALELQLVRERGYAVDEGQTAVAIKCVAAPLFNDRGCCGAIGVSYLLGGGPAASVVVEAIVDAAQRASDRLGGSLGGFLCTERQR